MLLPVEFGAGVIGVGGVRTGVVPGVGVETPEGGGVAFPIEGVPIPIGVDIAGGVGGVSPEGVGTVEGCGVETPEGIGTVEGWGAETPEGVGTVEG